MNCKLVEINNQTGYDLDWADLKSLAERALPEKARLSVAFIKASEIKKLNEKYRDSRGPTDVLAFKGDDLLGEVIIAPEVVEKQAKKNNLNFKDEIRRVLVHGILHLKGYDHKNKEDMRAMRREEKKFLSC